MAAAQLLGRCAAAFATPVGLRQDDLGKGERAMSDRERKYGFSFSWRRAIGLSALKGRISRAIGIPLTREGRQRKVGAMLGCCVPLAILLCGPVVVGVVVARLI